MIDSNSGISLLESSFKEFKDNKAEEGLFPGFFNAINRTIDSVQAAMSTGRKIDEILRIVEAEDSIIVIFFHPESAILFCSISDADDDISCLKDIMRKIATRFWKRHKADLKIFRSTTDKSKFQSLIVDIENLTMGGKIAEFFPKLLVVKGVLDKILSMGLIDEIDYRIASKCDGMNSPLKIAKELYEDRLKIRESIVKLKNLDIISF
ncbi:MAG: hypothetical protein JW891_00995 [Candidatus Lokiarchaeota archaeon]|nr:hypothetical protein [Candidatus Lokiarchaeota archaeon]